MDPIDGPQNFIRQIPCNAVSLTYCAEGSLQFGVIYNPFTDEVFHAVKDEGAFLSRTPFKVTKNVTLSQALVSIGTSPYDRHSTWRKTGPSSKKFSARYWTLLKNTGRNCEYVWPLQKIPA